jgi:hypothetical protein
MIDGPPIVIPLIDRLRSEYAELPTLRLTAVQIQGLCGVDAHLCDAVLCALVDVGFLAQDGDGMYVRGRPELTAAGVTSVVVT